MGLGAEKERLACHRRRSHEAAGQGVGRQDLASAARLENSRHTLLIEESELAEGVGFEPTLGLPLSLISSQVPSTAQPPFRLIIMHLPAVIIMAGNQLAARSFVTRGTMRFSQQTRIEVTFSTFQGRISGDRH